MLWYYREGKLMALNFQIGEISRFFNIPASTLRYWEDKGFCTRKKELKTVIGSTPLRIWWRSPMWFSIRILVYSWRRSVKWMAHPRSSMENFYWKAFRTGTAARAACSSNKETALPYTSGENTDWFERAPLSEVRYWYRVHRVFWLDRARQTVSIYRRSIPLLAGAAHADTAAGTTRGLPSLPRCVLRSRNRVFFGKSNQHDMWLFWWKKKWLSAFQMT